MQWHCSAVRGTGGDYAVMMEMAGPTKAHMAGRQADWDLLLTWVHALPRSAICLCCRSSMP